SVCDGEAPVVRDSPAGSQFERIERLGGEALDRVAAQPGDDDAAHGPKERSRPADVNALETRRQGIAGACVAHLQHPYRGVTEGAIGVSRYPSSTPSVSPARGRIGGTGSTRYSTEILMNFEKLSDRSRGFLQSAQTYALGQGHQRLLVDHLL